MANTRTLRFHDLEFAKMCAYMELSNKIDTRLGEKFVKKIPMRTFMAFVTGGTSLVFAAGRQWYQLTKKANAKDAVETFVDSERRLRDCGYVEWDTFPQSHIVIGGAPIEPAGQPTTCPLCKRPEMRKFVADTEQEILSCNFCNRIVAIKVSRVTGQPQEVLIPGLFAAAIPFTEGIEHLGDLALDMGDMLADVAGWLVDLVA